MKLAEKLKKYTTNNLYLVNLQYATPKFDKITNLWKPSIKNEENTFYDFVIIDAECGKLISALNDKEYYLESKEEKPLCYKHSMKKYVDVFPTKRAYVRRWTLSKKLKEFLAGQILVRNALNKSFGV